MKSQPIVSVILQCRIYIAHMQCQWEINQNCIVIIKFYGIKYIIEYKMKLFHFNWWKYIHIFHQKEREWIRPRMALGEGIGRCQTSTVFLPFSHLYLSKYLQTHKIYSSHFLGMKGELVKGNRKVLVINCPEGTRQVSEDEDNHLLNITKKPAWT